MWTISLLAILLLFPLLSAAPLDIAGGVENDNDGMQSHEENVTRRGKFFGHNQFLIGNHMSVDVEGDDASIGHNIDVDIHVHSHDHHHHEDTVIECKDGLRVLFNSIDSSKNGLIDANELLRVCHQNNIPITESLAVRILTLPDKTVGFNSAKFCELLKDCPSTNSADLINFLLQLYDKVTIEEREFSTPRPQPKVFFFSSPPQPQPKVTCPYKDDLSSVLLENNWRTQDEIDVMSEEDKRNSVSVEVEKMTGHTTEDLQRANAEDFGSLTAIANMAAILIMYSIKSSSEVKTMTYEPDLRNALIVETSKRLSIPVSTLQQMTDTQLLKRFCTVSTGCEVHVGKSTSNTISATVSEGCVCPTVVNKGNWIGDDTYADKFRVTQDGSSLQVQRTDSDNGWALDLSFKCNQECLADETLTSDCMCGGKICAIGGRCASGSRCIPASCQCGVKKQGTRIVGGVDSQVNEYPWIVYLSMGCGGSVIADRWVLTAAHCFYSNGVLIDASTVTITLGEHDRTISTETLLTKTVIPDKIIIHDSYDFSKNYINDLALLRLSSSIDVNIYTPVCLPRQGEVYTDQKVWVYGWGSLGESGSQSATLQELEITVVDDDVVKNKYGLTDTQLATMVFAGGEKGKDACQGDSGGPLSYDRNGQHELVGATSWGYGCARHGYPGVYTEVSAFRSWIDQKIAGANTC